MSSRLFSPITIDSLSLSNRIVIPPMCQYAAPQSLPTPWHHMHYGTLACSGTGMLIIEATGVQPEGRITPWCLGLWNDQQAQGHKQLLDDMRTYSTMPVGIQLAHAGRKGSTYPMWAKAGIVPEQEGGWVTRAPSGIPYNPTDPSPKALTSEEIPQLVKDFASAAERAHHAGYDFIELHAAHGYLLHQFLSPITNKRTDQYGGDLANRMRLTIEVFKAIRSAFPAEKPVGVRLSATDWIEDGWDVPSSVALLQELQSLGCAYAHISSGGLAPEQQLSPAPGYQTGFATTIKQAISIPTITVGLITSPEQAEHIVVSHQADMVAVGRGMLFNPRWPWYAALALGAKVNVPPQYWRGAPYTAKNLFEQPS